MTRPYLFLAAVYIICIVLAVLSLVSAGQSVAVPLLN